MSNPSKQKGTAGETRVVKYLAALGIPTERRALSGSQDKGDIKVTSICPVPCEWTIEVKAGKQTWNPNRKQIEEWLRQTKAEMKNSGCPGALIVLRYNRNINDADVYVPRPTDENIRSHMWLDEFVDSCLR